MKSMTGYGASQKTKKGVTVEVSLRAVNGRFFDLKTHLPSEYQSFEKDVRSVISKSVRRGSLSLVVVRKPSGGKSSKRIVFDEGLAKQWVQGFRALSKKVGLSSDLSLDALARLSDIAQVREEVETTIEEKDLVVAAVSEAVKTLDLERAREGKKLFQDIEERIQNLELLREKVSEFRDESNLQMKMKFEKRWQELSLSVLDPKRLSEEIIWYLEKADISEELTRLKEHLRHFQALMKDRSGQGKKLDFYTQEILREINTIGSKANHSRITQLVIELKTIIEQVKEQVQNIE